MSLLKFTTQIDVERTIGEIQRLLGSHGASSIKTDYENRVISAISFIIPVGEQKFPFRLPCDWRPVLKVMENDRKIPRRLCEQTQAVRVAWRIVLAWIEAQMAFIDSQMVSTEDVFLPYMIVNGGKTLSENMKINPNFLIGDGK
jgi:hypothetical protein